MLWKFTRNKVHVLAIRIQTYATEFECQRFLRIHRWNLQPRYSPENKGRWSTWIQLDRSIDHPRNPQTVGQWSRSRMRCWRRCWDPGDHWKKWCWWWLDLQPWVLEINPKCRWTENHRQCAEGIAPVANLSAFHDLEE